MQNISGISRRSILKGISAIPVAAALGPVRAQNRSKVIVIGAGLSGLNAALLLEEQGIDVQVIEGRSRVGGRVLSHRNVNGNPESGGTSFGPGYARLMDACKRFKVGLIDVTPIVPFFNDRELVLDGTAIPNRCSGGRWRSTKRRVGPSIRRSPRSSTISARSPR